MDERYIMKTEYILMPEDIYPVYEQKYSDNYRLVAYRYRRQECECTYYLVERFKYGL